VSESARIHAAIRAAILDVELVPGAAIIEAGLAERFGVSRTPVREALLRLSDEGLVEIRPQRGTSVARLSLDRIEEALFVRRAVECAVIARVFERGEHRAVGIALGAIVNAQAAAIDRRDVAATLDADTQFHHVLVAASGLPGVWRVVAQARDLHHRIRAIAVPELGSATQAIRDHRAIANALRDGRPGRAITALTTHLAGNMTLARAIARRHPDYFDDVAVRAIAEPARAGRAVRPAAP
jgi:DNA-binding GntR family transcriptional regulator